MDVRELESYLENNMTEYIRFLEEMVGINSFTSNKEGIDALSDLTARWFSSAGFSSRKIPCSDKRYGSHLILGKPGRSLETIGFISHLDTVFSSEEEHRNAFHWKIDGDRVYGPGTVDIKGGTMMIYILMDLLKTFEPELYDQSSFRILLDCAEEVGGSDFGELCRRELSPGETLACLVFEGSRIEGNQHHQVVARKGMATYNVESFGRSAHSGTSHRKGINAIVQMSRMVDQLASLTDYDKKITVNVGRIEGGTVRNRVPDYCRCEVEMRAEDSKSYFDTVKSIDRLKELPAEISLFDSKKGTVHIEREVLTPPWEVNDLSEKLYLFWAIASEELGFSMNREIRGGLSDGNLLWQDYPVLDGLGPGGDNSHCSEQNKEEGKEQEYMSLSSVISVAMINFRAIVNLLRKSS